MSRFVARTLTADESFLARRLIYRVYVEEMGWMPSSCNPSNYRVECEQGEHILTDDGYEEKFHLDRLF